MNVTPPVNIGQLEVYKTAVIAWLVAYGPKLIGAFLFWVIGSWVINYIAKIVDRSMKHHLYDVSLQAFVMSLLTIGLRIMLIISVAGMIGIETTSFIAIFGALGLGMGLALQGSLANFAGGVLILIFKPFKVNDVIEAQSQTGQVKSIGIFSTVLETGNHKSIIIPNGILSNGIIVNWTNLGYMVSEIKLELDDSKHILDLRKELLTMLQEDTRVLKNPEPSFLIVDFTPKLIVSLSVYTSAENQDATVNDIKDKLMGLLVENVIPGAVNRITVEKPLA